MFNEISKVIISQRYVQKSDGAKASLIDLIGNSALIETENGLIEKIALERFSQTYILAAAL